MTPWASYHSNKPLVWQLLLFDEGLPSPWRHDKHMKSCVRDEWEGKDGNKCNSLEYWEAKRMKGSIKPPVLPEGGRWVRSPDVLRVTPGVSWPLSGKFKLAKVQPCPSSTVIYFIIFSNSSQPLISNHQKAFHVSWSNFLYHHSSSKSLHPPFHSCQPPTHSEKITCKMSLGE